QVAVPGDVTVIAPYAFAGNDRVAICAIPAGVTAIGKGAFQYCTGLVRIALPATLQSFGDNVFLGCVRLTELINPSALDLSGDFYINYYSPAILTDVGKSEIYQDNDFILRTHEGKKTLLGYVGENAEIVIPADIDAIGHHALYHTSIEKVTVAANVATLEPYTFGGCVRLKELRFGASVTYVDTFGIERHYVLSDIYFDGTMAQFEAILTPESSSSYAGVVPLTEFLSPRTTIHCTDGTLTGTGTIFQ
ncbi:MAG: leucine-rich repeat domain-containing protein, partial [Clostridia bacterium]|nr:leucine-rich repeat domain-containing protein [Clostridia bacterium]